MFLHRCTLASARFEARAGPHEAIVGGGVGGFEV